MPKAKGRKGETGGESADETAKFRGQNIGEFGLSLDLDFWIVGTETEGITEDDEAEEEDCDDDDDDED